MEEPENILFQCRHELVCFTHKVDFSSHYLVHTTYDTSAIFEIATVIFITDCSFHSCGNSLNNEKL